jgi:hypothetical protein
VEGGGAPQEGFDAEEDNALNTSQENGTEDATEVPCIELVIGMWHGHRAGGGGESSSSSSSRARELCLAAPPSATAMYAHAQVEHMATRIYDIEARPKCLAVGRRTPGGSRPLLDSRPFLVGSSEGDSFRRLLTFNSRPEPQRVACCLSALSPAPGGPWA